VFLTGDAAHVHSPAGGESMNTGMQDAFNLAWKLALAMHGTCGDARLDTYIPERSGVGDEVLKNTARLTTIGTLRNPVAEDLRNIVGRVAFGLATVRRAFADRMSQVSVGYPESPMNAGGHSSFRPTLASAWRRSPGSRHSAQATSRASTLLASPSPAVAGALSSFPKLLNAALGPPPDANGVWLIRPDGYVAATAPASDLSSISDVLRRIGV
jgi:hypothetical protein